MGIEYRKFQKSDLLDFADLSDDEWMQAHIGLAHSMINCNNEIERCYVALDDGVIIGYIYGFALPNKTLIPEFMYVQPKYRRSGVGANLLKLLEEESGCNASMIFYHKSMHNHYEKLGYSTGENLETAMKTLVSEEEG